MTFVRRPGESNNDALARYEEEILAAGAMGWVERPDAMRAFLSSTFTNGLGAWKTKGTTCALFQGGCLQGSGVQARRPLPTIYGITTWMHASWFSGPEWIPWAKLASGEEQIIRGDLPYWAGSAHPYEPDAIWQASTYNHVGCAREGSGFLWSTSEGGGANGRCVLSAEPKDISASHGRALRGIWRPNWMASAIRRFEPDTIPAPPPTLPTGTPRTLRLTLPRMSGFDVEQLQMGLGIRADGVFGPQTDTAVRAFQSQHGLDADGVVGLKTWRQFAVSNPLPERS